jgi:Mg-chelatase subunit ChlD
MELSSYSEFAQVEFNASPEMLVLANLKAPLVENTGVERAPLRIAAVIDRSGSMAGEKIQLVKKSMECVIQQLKPTDQFGIVAFDDTVETMLPLTSMTPEGKARALHAAEGINDRGSTNLSGGLFVGLDLIAGKNISGYDPKAEPESHFQPNIGYQSNAMLNNCYQSNSCMPMPQQQQQKKSSIMSNLFQRKTPSPPPIVPSAPLQAQVLIQPEPQPLIAPLVTSEAVSSTPDGLVPVPDGMLSSVWLFTDGMANVGIVDETELCTKTSAIMEKLPLCTLYTFGFGNDHNASMLQKLASSGGGVYYYVEGEQSILTCYGDCLGGLTSVVAQNLELTIVVPAGSAIKTAHTTYTVRQDTPTRAVVTIKDMYSEEKRDVLFTLTPGVIPQPMEGWKCAEFELKYTNAVTKEAGTTNSELFVDRPEHAEKGEVPVALDIQRNRLTCSEALKEATKLADSGNVKQAQSVIQAAIDKISASRTAQDSTSQGLITSLQLALQSVKSKEEYNKGGQQMLNCHYSAHSKQRSNVQTSAFYGNASKAMMQAKFT